jgi:hypothetical protein
VLNLKRCTRLVILPDYQGIGLGMKFLTEIAKIYTNKKYQFTIVTSAKNMIGTLNKSEEWALIRYGIEHPSNCKTSRIDYKRTSVRSNCATASFKYIGKEKKIWQQRNQKK